MDDIRSIIDCQSPGHTLYSTIGETKSLGVEEQIIDAEAEQEFSVGSKTFAILFNNVVDIIVYEDLEGNKTEASKSVIVHVSRQQ